MTTGSERRAAILERIKGLVCRDRQALYADAEDNFADIAKLASVVLERKLKIALAAEDVAIFCACIKLARLKTSPAHIDNWDDLAGYAVCGAGVVEAAQERFVAVPAPAPRHQEVGGLMAVGDALVVAQDTRCICGARVSEYHKPDCPRRHWNDLADPPG